MTALARIAPALIGVLVVGLLWEGLVRALNVPAYFLPPPSAVLSELTRNAPLLLASAWETLRVSLIALAIAIVTGLGLALILSLSPFLERAVAPLAVTLQVTPVVAIAPLVVIWVGLAHAERAILILAAIVAFFPVFSASLSGLASADPDLERLFRLYRAGPVARLFRLRLPAAAPYILAGVKIAGGLALIGTVVAEFVAGTGAAQGLAWRILEAGNRLATASMFAALAALALLGIALHFLLSRLESWALSRFGPPREAR